MDAGLVSAFPFRRTFPPHNRRQAISSMQATASGTALGQRGGDGCGPSRLATIRYQAPDHLDPSHTARQAPGKSAFTAEATRPAKRFDSNRQNEYRDSALV